MQQNKRKPAFLQTSAKSYCAFRHPQFDFIRVTGCPDKCFLTNGYCEEFFENQQEMIFGEAEKNIAIFEGTLQCQSMSHNWQMKTISIGFSLKKRILKFLEVDLLSQPPQSLQKKTSRIFGAKKKSYVGASLLFPHSSGTKSPRMRERNNSMVYVFMISKKSSGQFFCLHLCGVMYALTDKAQKKTPKPGPKYLKY